MRLCLSLLPLFALLPYLLAVPLEEPPSSPLHCYSQSTPARSAPPRRPSVFPQLTWLRDSIIQTVFRLPAPSSNGPRGQSSAPLRPSRPQVPPALLAKLAKYGGDVVLRFNLSTAEEEAALAEAADTLFLDVWEFNRNWADIRLREDDVPSLLGLLPKSLPWAYSSLMPDLARSIYQSYPSIPFADAAFAGEHAFTPELSRPCRRQEPENIFFQEYQPLSVIVPWMRLMASMFTTHVRMIKIGVSYEGRDIHALRVGVHSSQDQSKPRRTILINGGVHAREWISISTVTYLAWSMITSYGKNPEITKLVLEFDWVFIPTINVDGYVYTWESDRLWRKNRQQTNLPFCRGLDLGRGFSFQWDGASFQSNPCSESYPGDAPFQAVESHRLAEWAKNETSNNSVEFVGFLDLHSYSQQVLYPYSYSCSAEPPTIENLEELGVGIAKAIRVVSGEGYMVASACEGAVPFSAKTKSKSKSKSKISRMETGGGSAIDWFYHEMRVRYSYQVKLRDTGAYGFLLPAHQIVPTGMEAFNALKYFGDFLLGNNGIENVGFADKGDIDGKVVEVFEAGLDGDGDDDDGGGGGVLGVVAEIREEEESPLTAAEEVIEEGISSSFEFEDEKLKALSDEGLASSTVEEEGKEEEEEEEEGNFEL